MKHKCLVFVAVCLLLSPVFGDNSQQVFEGYVAKPMEIAPQPDFYSQVLKGEKPGVIVTNAFTISDGEPEDYYDVNMIHYATTKEIYFFATFTVMWKTNMRLHFIITGPEYYTYTTEVLKPKYNYRYYYYVYGNKSVFFSKKGIYKLIVYAEQIAPFGGETVVATSTFRVY